MKLLLPALLVLAAGTTAQSVSYSTQILYINEVGSPHNVIPGLSATFRPGSGTSTAFRRPFVSSNGQHWAIEASANDADVGGPGFNNVYIVDGELIAQEGTQAPWALPGELFGSFDTRIQVNDGGTVLITNRLRGSAPSSNNDYVVSHNGGVFTVVAREGDLVDPILPTFAGAIWDDGMTSPTLDNANNFSWLASGVDGTPGGSADDSLAVYGMGLLAVEGGIPAGQAGGAMDAWEAFDSDEQFISADGLTSMVRGNLDSSSSIDDVIAFNGVIVLQEGSPVPGSSFIEPIENSGLNGSWLDHAGNWFAYGQNETTEQDWAVRNGVVVATADAFEEIFPGAGEHWDDASYGDCFFGLDGNASGTFVIGGTTDAPSDSDGVLVIDDGMGSRSLVCREGQALDLDGNGLLDDDRFFDRFGSDDVRMLDDGSLLFVASLKDGTGTPVSAGLFRIATKWKPYGLSPSSTNALVLSGDGSTALGATFRAVTSNLHPTAPASLTLISVGSTSIPIFGGALLIDPNTIQNQILVGLNDSGKSVAGVTIPVSQSLVGMKTYFQSVANDPTQPAGKMLSNGLEVTLTN